MTVLYTAADIAERLGVKPATVSTWASRGWLPDPQYTTTRGDRLWTTDGAIAVVQARLPGVEKRRQAKAQRELDRHQLSIALLKEKIEP